MRSAERCMPSGEQTRRSGVLEGFLGTGGPWGVNSEDPGGPDLPGFPFLDLGFLDFRESTQFSSSDFDWVCLGGVKN